jgi:NAD(P)-dependent dehydrogenase (short-subunit alcohol dehydrogenase family)
MVQGKRVIVTGGGRGIGRAIVEAFVEAGARVAIADIEGAEHAAKEIGGDTVGLTCDVSSGESVANALAIVGESFGGLDVVVNNAGVDALAPLHELSEDAFDKVVSVNLRGTWLVYKHAVPLMGGGGAIVNVASLAGIVGFPLLGAYAAAKAGVVRMTEVMAVELRDLGVRANAICPGFIDTPMVGRANDEFEAATGQPMADYITAKQGRLGTPQEVASLALFLASDAAAFVNGTAITIDGGMNVNRI